MWIWQGFLFKSSLAFTFSEIWGFIWHYYSLSELLTQVYLGDHKDKKTSLMMVDVILTRKVMMMIMMMMMVVVVVVMLMMMMDDDDSDG